MQRDDAMQLANIRQTRGISLEQIANETKISVRSLRAIEEGEFKKLPGGIYNTSYIRQYARAIEYDECALIAFYTREMARGEGAPCSGSNGNGVYRGFFPASLVGR